MCVIRCYKAVKESQSPQTGQFNSYEQALKWWWCWLLLSQSPQTGQFNSYRGSVDLYIKIAVAIVSIPSNGSIQFLQRVGCLRLLSFLISLNPLKRVNSILT